jgi:proteasome beta subunit
VAISGSFARSIEICRMLKHSFNYYRRMHLNEMSLDGKLQEISRALADNVPMAMQGIGVFVPILAAYDPRADDFNVYFFDTAGARFENSAYAAAGSGSERIRGIFEYLARTKKPWAERSLEEVLGDALTMLDIAADLDSATGGFMKTLPMAQTVTREGTQPVEESVLKKAVAKVLAK